VEKFKAKKYFNFGEESQEKPDLAK